MVWELGLRSRLLVATGVTLIITALPHAPAKAADLGGDCCADLEERVAELEATTVRKGNKKVTIELYGDTNKNILIWDDGVEANTYFEDNGYKTSRFGFRGKGKIGGDWSGGYRLEVEVRVARSRNLDQFDDNNADDPLGSLNVRHSYIYLASKKYGEFRLGLSSTAKDDITKDTNVAGAIIDTMHSDFFFNNFFFLRSKRVAPNAGSISNIRWQDIERCYSSSSAVFDCSTRRNQILWQTPKWFGSSEGNGLWFNAGYGEDDIWSVSARYKEDWQVWKVGAGVAFEKFTDELVNNGGGGAPFQGWRQDLDEWGGEASIMHKPTGLFTQFAFTTSEDNSSNAHGVFTGKHLPTEFAWDVSVGIQKKWWELGNTTFWGGFTRVQDAVGFGLTAPRGAGLVAAGRFPGIDFTTEATATEVEKWYLALDQEVIPGAMNIYLGYQHITGELDLVDAALDPVSAPFHDFDLVFSGARIYF
jgi:predicted porin